MKNQDYTAQSGLATLDNNGAGLKSELNSLKNKLNTKANALGDEINQKLDQAKTRAGDSLEATSRNLDKAAHFLQENSYDDMLDNVKDLVRKHPAKSIVFGLGLGVILGRALR